MAMGTAFTSASRRIPDANSIKGSVSSTFDKTVCLQDWWLVRSENEFEGKRLAVGGLTAERPMRLFSSAPIIRRHDLFTLETADGITVMIKGSVNRSRMHKNGFRTEVCSHFLLGFPYYWEDFADQCFEKESNTGGFSPSPSGRSNKRENPERSCSDEHENGPQRGVFEEQSETVRGDASEDFTMQFKEKTVSSSDTELHNTDKFNRVVETRNPANASKGNRADFSCEKMRIHNSNALKDHSLPTNSNLKSISPSEVDMSIEKYSRTRLRSLKMVESLTKRMKTICSSSKRPNVNDLVTPLGKKFHAIDSSSLSNISLEGDAKKYNLASPDLRKCCGDALQAAAPTDLSKVVGSDANDVNPYESNMAFPMKTSLSCLESSSGEVESSKSCEKSLNKTNSSFEREELISLRNCDHDNVNDGSLKGALAPADFGLKLSGMSEMKAALIVGTSSNHPKTSFGKLEGLNREGKNATIAEKCVSQENEPMVAGTPEENLCDGNGECLSDVRFDGVVDEFLPVAPGNLEFSEKSSNCTFNAVEDSAVLTNVERTDACSDKSSPGNTTTTINALTNLENKGGKSLKSECGVKNGNGCPIVLLPPVENLDSEHQDCSASNEGKRGRAVEIVSSFEPRRSSRLKGLKNINNMLETKNNKVKSVSLGSEVVKKAVSIIESESGCGAAMDFSSIESERTTCEPLVKGENLDSQHEPRITSLLPSTPDDAIQKQNTVSDMNATGSSEQNELCRSSIQVDDVNCKNNLKVSVEGEESHHTERRISQKRTKRKLEYVTDVITPMQTRSWRKNITLVSPESLSYKRSRSGRLLVPPVDFWRNEQVVYNMDGQITGITPVVKTHAGRVSEPMRKKKKFK